MSRAVAGQGDSGVATAVVECDPADLDQNASIRDLDQLPPADRRAVIEAADGTQRLGETSRLTPGDVVRFTAYYRVV
ncbi:MAG: hypothetical protein ABEK02_07685 [Haloquadratum sp.]